MADTDPAESEDKPEAPEAPERSNHELIKLPVGPYNQLIALAAHLQAPLEVVLSRAVGMLHCYHTQYKDNLTNASVGVDIGQRVKDALVTYGTREGTIEQLLQTFLHVRKPGPSIIEALYTLYRSGAPYLDLLLGGPVSPMLKGSHWRFNADAHTRPFRPPIDTIIKRVTAAIRSGKPRRRAQEWIDDLIPPVDLHGYTPEGIFFTASRDPDREAPVLRYPLKHPPLYSVRYPGWNTKPEKPKRARPRQFVNCIRGGIYHPGIGNPVKVNLKHVANALVTLQTGRQPPHPELDGFTNAHCELLIKACGDEKLVEESVRESLRYSPLQFDIPADSGSISPE